jgi:hypothetical protein
MNEWSLCFLKLKTNIFKHCSVNEVKIFLSMVGIQSPDPFTIPSVWSEGSLIDGRFTLLHCILCNEDIVLWRAHDNVEEGTRTIIEQTEGQ